MTGIVARWFGVVSLLGLLALQAQEADKKPSLSPDGKFITVVAEGAGENVDDALKNAIRAAVQQAVGVFVEQEEKLKNDEIISSKILTASNGFVAEFKRLDLSRKDGLVRLRIQAQVERGELLRSLREFKVRVVEVDPNRLKEQRFSDAAILAMSKEELRRNRTEIVHDLLVDLPKTLEARCKVPDRFDYDKKTSTLKLELVVGPDYAQYAAFLKRLQMRLDKLAVGKVQAGFVGKPKDLSSPLNDVRGFHTEDTTQLIGPDLTEVPEGWCLWFMTQVFNNGAGTRWTGYVLDTDVRKVLGGLQGKLQVQLNLRDAAGANLAEKTVDLTQKSYLASVVPRNRKGTNASVFIATPFQKLSGEVKVTEAASVNALVAPLAFWPVRAPGGSSMGLQHTLTRGHEVRVTLSPDDLQRLKDIRCTVQFKAAN